MEDILIWLYFGAVNFFLLKNYRIIESKKSRLKLYIALSVSVLLWFISFYIFLNNLFDNMLTVFALTSNIFLVLALLLIRMLWKPQKWYAVLFLPLAVFFSIGLASLNKPAYNGAMDGFANFHRFVSAILIIFFLFPIFLFLYKMLNLKQIIKSAILILTAIAGFAYGITLSIGINGYLSDNTGGWFLFLSIWLVIIGLANKNNMNTKTLLTIIYIIAITAVWLILAFVFTMVELIAIWNFVSRSDTAIPYLFENTGGYDNELGPTGLCLYLLYAINAIWVGLIIYLKAKQKFFKINS